MDRLSKLRKSILDMSYEEKLEMIKAVREDRRMSKAPALKEKKTAKQQDALEKAFAKMSPEDKAALLAVLAEG